jgi:DNA-binding PadR family transcriptional regulator
MGKFAFLKFLLLNFIEKKGEITGYDFLKYCKDEGIPASAGTVYPQLGDLMKSGILNRRSEGRKKFYYLTEEGKKFLKDIQSNKEVFKNLANRVGVAMDNPYMSMPKEMQAVFKGLFYRIHAVDWKKKKDVEALIEDLKKVEKHIKEWLDRMQQK